VVFGPDPADVPEIVQSHFQNGTPVKRLTRTDVDRVRAAIVTNRDRMIAARRARPSA